MLLVWVRVCFYLTQCYIPMECMIWVMLFVRVRVLKAFVLLGGLGGWYPQLVRLGFVRVWVPFCLIWCCISIEFMIWVMLLVVESHLNHINYIHSLLGPVFVEPHGSLCWLLALCLLWVVLQASDVAGLAWPESPGLGLAWAYVCRGSKMVALTINFKNQKFSN